jgi:adenylosuccinate synthase
VYKELPGWEDEVEGCTDYDKLPENCRKYIEFVEDFLGVPIGIVSTGPDRDHVIERIPIFAK